jgi:hypothetical protein
VIQAGPGDVIAGVLKEGPVGLPLPGGGLALASGPDIDQWRALAAELRPGLPSLVTVAVAVQHGDFLIADHSERLWPGGAGALAAALAELPLYGCEVRMWLSWPTSAEDGRRLRRHLDGLAEIVGATVWAPVEGSRVEPLDGCRDLSAVDSRGQPTGWDAYGWREPTFRSDPDGRLVPAGPVAVSSYPGVPLVSLPGPQEQELARDYQRLNRAVGWLQAAVAILPDGRLALRYQDDTLLAAGPCQLRRLLTDAGWTGGDVALIGDVGVDQASVAHEHATSLAGALGCRITFDQDLSDTDLSAVDGRVGSSRLDAGSAGVPMRYPRAAVGRALAGLDPGDPSHAALLTALAAAVADHAGLDRRLQHAPDPQRAKLTRDLAASARTIEALATAASPAMASSP